MSNNFLISAGYLPCMSRSTCTMNVKTSIILPLPKESVKFSMSDYDYSSSDEGGNSSSSDEEEEKDDVTVVKETETTPAKKQEPVKYSEVADIISNYISNIKGI